MDKNLEVRALPITLEARTAAEGGKRTIAGKIKYNTESAVMRDFWGDSFVEELAAGCFDESLKTREVIGLWSHETSQVLGNTKAGTLRVNSDQTGLNFELDLPRTRAGDDAWESIKRGDVDGVSFGMRVNKDKWSNADQVYKRTILDADLYEISPVAFAAYPDNEVACRSLEEYKNQGGNAMKLEEREARQRLAELKEQQKALLEKEELTDEERANQLVLAKEIRTLETRLESFKKDPVPEPKPPVVTTAPDESREAFVNYLRGREYDTRAMTVGTATSGGYMAPEGFLAQVIQKLNELTVMRGLARTIVIGNDSVKIPRLTSSVNAAWTAEAAAITPGDPAFDQVEFNPYKLAAMTLVSNELLGDSAVNVETLLAQLFAEKIAEVEDQAFFKGTGTGQPKGILTEAGIARVNTAAANAITADEVINLYDALPPAYRGTATWVMNPATMNQLRKLKDGTSGQYLLISGLTGNAPNYLMGRPVMLSSNMDTIAAGKDVILFGDLARAYYIVDRQGLEVLRSVDRYFEQDLTAFRAIKRTDGKLVLPDACCILQMAAA